MHIRQHGQLTGLGAVAAQRVDEVLAQLDQALAERVSHGHDLPPHTPAARAGWRREAYRGMGVLGGATGRIIISMTYA